MKYVLLIIVLFGPLATYAADSFEERTREAHRLEHATDQRTYQALVRSKLRAKMNKLMAGCIRSAYGSKPSSFAVVGDITRSSSVENVKVKPGSDFAKCFAGALSRVRLPAPPDSFEGNSYPIALDMNFH